MDEGENGLLRILLKRESMRGKKQFRFNFIEILQILVNTKYFLNIVSPFSVASGG